MKMPLGKVSGFSISGRGGRGRGRGEKREKSESDRITSKSVPFDAYSQGEQLCGKTQLVKMSLKKVPGIFDF